MEHVLVLISDPARPALEPATADAARAAVAGGKPRWLMEHIACEIPFTANAGDRGKAESAARRALADAPVDVAVLPAAGRRKRLLLADMDSTVIGQECIDELADMVGLKAEVAAITERAMRGDIAFEPALRERVALLAGLPLSQVERVIAERITVTPGARALVATMRAHGARTVLVSGGFTLFTAEVAARVGFDENRANELILDGDSIAGRVREPILGREAKLAELRAQRDFLAIAPEETIAVGDGANDLAMLGEAGLGVAFHAKPAVAEAAAARIDHGDLTALLFLQGYSANELAGEAG